MNSTICMSVYSPLVFMNRVLFLNCFGFIVMFSYSHGKLTKWHILALQCLFLRFEWIEDGPVILKQARPF